jgi:hypothetical protein
MRLKSQRLKARPGTNHAAIRGWENPRKFRKIEDTGKERKGYAKFATNCNF